jgi:hypothetical protein
MARSLLLVYLSMSVTIRLGSPVIIMRFIDMMLDSCMIITDLD